MNQDNTYFKYTNGELQSISDFLYIGQLIDPETGDFIEMVEKNLYDKDGRQLV